MRMTERPPSDVTVDTMAEKVAFITSTIDDLRNRLDTAESQRDTLRTALIEAQSVLQQFAPKPLENGNLVHNLNVFRLPGSESQLYGPQGEFCDFCGNPWPCATQQARDALARIREALEGTANKEPSNLEKVFTRAMDSRVWVGCHAGMDGDCSWESCPQIKDGEPMKTGRHCPLDQRDEEE